MVAYRVEQLGPMVYAVPETARMAEAALVASVRCAASFSGRALQS